MALTKRIGLGVTLGVNTTGGTATQWTAVAAIVDGFDQGPAKSDVADTSVLADTFKTKGKGQTDPGEVTFMIAYDPADAVSSQKLALLLADYTSFPTWQILYPAYAGAATKSETFTAQLTGMGRQIKKDKMNIAPITLTVTGDPGISTS